jgi:hypothetical protein
MGLGDGEKDGRGQRTGERGWRQALVWKKWRDRVKLIGMIPKINKIEN